MPILLVVSAACLGATAAEKNLLDNDGYFAPGGAALLTPEKLPAKCAASVVPGVYEKGTSLYAVTNKSPDCVLLWTKTVPVCGDLMVFEVMARAVGRPTDCSVIGITSRYKQISHKRYRLTNGWRKYVAILAVPADAKGPDRLWRGRVDIPSGATVEIGRLSLYPAKTDESIAGMAKTADEEDAEARKKALGPNLADFDGPVPTADAFVSSQIGNMNAITVLPTRRSDEYDADSALGVSITGPAFCQCPVSGRNYPIWSCYWAIADDDLRKTAPCATFSTHMLSLGTKDANLTVRLAAPVPVAKLRITTRGRTLAGMPYDWHVDVSENGTSFRTVWTVTNFSAKGESPERALDGRPVAAIRIVADRIRPEGKGFGYFQLDQVEALDAAGVNHALISKGATADTNYRMVVPVVDRASYLEDAIVKCGIKTVLLYGCSIFDGHWPVLTEKGGFRVGSPSFETYTANLRYLKAHGIRVYVRQTWGHKRLFALRTQEDLDRFKAEYISKITPFVKAWKGLVDGYPLAGEENQYFVIGRGRDAKFDIAFFKRAYRETVIAASDAIHAIDPAAKTSVITALFDFGWTEEHLRNGLARALDEVSVDLYHEMDPFGAYPEKCESFFVDGRRGFEEERLFTRAEDELKAFRKLLDKYNPKLAFGVHEMSQRIGPYPKGINTTERGQAKSALRTYIMHQYYNVVPSCWWDFCGSRTIERNGDFYEWGVIAAGVKRQAWYAMQRFAAVFDSSWKPLGEFPLSFTPADRRYYSYLFGRGKERLAVCWAAVSMRDGNTGKLADVFVPGSFGETVPAVECIDLLNGGVQCLNVEKASGGFLVRGLVMRDYPLVFRYREAPGA